MRKKAITFVALLGTVTIAACSSAPGEEEQTEDGWGELQSSGYITPGEPALESDVNEDDLAIEDEVSDENMTAIDDSEIESTEDDLPDIDVSEPSIPRALEHQVIVPENADVESSCGTTGPYTKYAKGAQLVTTEWLNLRTAPGTNHKIVTTMKPGTAVAVLDATCGRRWAHIKDSHGHVGYSAVDWLRPKSVQNKPTGWAAYYSAARGQKLASKSWSMWHSSSSHGYCLKGVRMSIAASISPGFATGSPGAHQFGQYARAHRAWMDQHHLHVYANGEKGMPSPANYPVGTVMVFSKGRCGMNATWGHVEIVINSKTACSDHCRHRTDKYCAPDTVLIPRK